MIAGKERQGSGDANGGELCGNGENSNEETAKKQGRRGCGEKKDLGECEKSLQEGCGAVDRWMRWRIGQKGRMERDGAECFGETGRGGRTTRTSWGPFFGAQTLTDWAMVAHDFTRTEGNAREQTLSSPSCASSARPLPRLPSAICATVCHRVLHPPSLRGFCCNSPFSYLSLFFFLHRPTTVAVAALPECNCACRALLVHPRSLHTVHESTEPPFHATGPTHLAPSR